MSKCTNCRNELENEYRWVWVLTAIDKGEGYDGKLFCSTWCAVDHMGDDAMLNNLLLERAQKEREQHG